MNTLYLVVFTTYVLLWYTSMTYSILVLLYFVRIFTIAFVRSYFMRGSFSLLILLSPERFYIACNQLTG